MFKKPAESKSQQRLSGADRKKLKRTIKERFPHASDEDIDTLLPPKVEITVSKFPNRVHVYGLEGGFPMFFDADGRGKEIFPTVFALWKVSDLLPAFMLKGGEVSRFIIGGADLMFPGIKIPAEGLPPFSAGEIWAVKVPGNLAPIAVGSTTVGSVEALKAGFRGKALRVTHCYGDSLWASVDGQYVPNAGFLEDVVFEDPSLSFVSEACESSEPDGPNDENNAVNEVGAASHQLDGLTDQGHTPATHADTNSDISEQLSMDVGGMKLAEGVCTESSDEGHHSLSTEDIDALLDNCLLQALHMTVKDRDFPLPGSTLWSNHVLPCRPPGVTLDIKKSSYKKLSKWLQSKSSAGLISTKEDKHKKEVVLSSVNRSHPDYTSFKPVKQKVMTNVEVATDHSADEGISSKVLEVEEIYKPSVHVNPIFNSVGADKGQLYSASEASDVVFRYIEQENLVKQSDKATVVLDAILCDALYKGTVKKGSTYPTEIHKKDLGLTFVSRMQPHHRVSRGKESAVRKGALKTIQILTERRQGNKKVTKLSGLESFLIDAESLASELQKKFACSTTVGELPGKKGHEVVVQGGVIDNLGRHLIDQYGVPKKYIEVYDKTKK